MRTLIPFAAEEPKSRLGSIFSADERRDFARTMLEDVVATVRDAGGRPTILATDQLEDAPAELRVDERPLSVAVNDHLDPPMAIVMADLPLATPVGIQRVFESPGDVVMVPGRGGGTNVLAVRDEEFSVDFHGISAVDHREIARTAQLTLTEVDSHRLSTDVDEPADLAEVLLHGQGEAPGWLRAHGVSLTATDGRVGVTRE